MKFIHLNHEKNTDITLTEPGKYVAFMKNISGEFIFHMEAEKIDLEIYGVFDGKNQDDFRIHTVQHHAAPNSISNLLIKGVFDDESKFHYTGLVKIDKNAQGSHAYQKNQNLILSPAVFVESEPFLEIEANEVFCTHGSTTGKLNEDDIYYLRSRGISDGDSRKLLVDGFLDEILHKLKSEHNTTI
ncbi:SufD family Fe-S cluster assembly protein [Candidatus Microgenomates bacterium]|nr:SufD family Fe-S cluster assembly protein [Candidatus Microgenomates bacterium]